MARILLGVTGGIAAYKSCELCRLLVKAGHDVVPLVTRGAERFVTAETFRALARRPAGDDPYAHLQRADLFVVAPLTANTLAKLARGLADNVLTEAALAHRGPVLVAPAMNPRMWSHPATQSNVALLRERGVELIGPDEGEMAEGEWGVGRMSEPEEIAAAIRSLLATDSPLRGLRVLVSAGGTREPLDAVRYVGNRSSGRMGVALAAEARRRGAEVTLLAANLAVPPPDGVELVQTPTAEELGREALERADVDVVVMAAAVADYRPAVVQPAKRKKDAHSWTVELEPTLDVLQAIGERRTDSQVLVGFAAETGEGGLERARDKLARKHLDLVVYNDVSEPGVGFDAPKNEVVLVGADGNRSVPRAAKTLVAAAILDEIERLHRVAMSDAYELFQQGRRHLRNGMAAQATVALEKAKRLEPEKAVDPRGARDRVPPTAPARRGGRRVPEDPRALAGRRLRPLRARSLPRAPGQPRRGERPLQARPLAASRQRAVRGSDPRPRPTRHEGGRATGFQAPPWRWAAWCGRGSGPGCSSCSASRAATRTPGRPGSPGRSRGCACSRTSEGRFDRSLLDTGGAALVVSQFTLLADTREGQPPELLRCRAAGGGRAALRGVLRRASESKASRSRRASSARGCRSSSSTTARSRSSSASRGIAILSTPQLRNDSTGARCAPFL